MLSSIAIVAARLSPLPFHAERFLARILTGDGRPDTSAFEPLALLLWAGSGVAALVVGVLMLPTTEEDSAGQESLWGPRLDAQRPERGTGQDRKPPEYDEYTF